MEDALTDPVAAPPRPDGGEQPAAWTEVAQLARQRRRGVTERTRGDLASATVLGVGFVAFAAVAAAVSPWPGGSAVAVAVALVVLYAVAYRTEFESVAGSAVPTQPVLVALFFTLPPGAVPLAVLLGLLAGGGLAERPRPEPYAVLVRALSGWHCAGPTVVLWVAGMARPDVDRWPVLALALAAQFALDGAVAALRAVILGASRHGFARALSFTFGVDLFLAPLACCAGAVTDRPVAVVLLAAAPVGLLRLLSSDRRKNLATALELGEALETVRDEARADALTGLANRRAWEEALQHAARAGGRAPIVLAADVDGLKRINDTHGHEAGDELLLQVAHALREALPAALVVARLGGDEFGALVPADGGETMATVLTRVRAAVSARVLACGEPVSASLGAALGGPDARTMAEAVRFADERAAADKRARRVGRA